MKHLFHILIVVLLLLALSACGSGTKERKEERKSGAVTVQTIKGEATALEMKHIVLKQEKLGSAGPTTGPLVYLKSDKQGSRVELEGPEDLLPEIKVSFSGGRLSISGPADKSFLVSENIAIRLYDYAFETLSLTGGIAMRVEDDSLVREEEKTKLTITLSEASGLVAPRIKAEEIILDIRGSSIMSPTWISCRHWKLDLSGASQFAATGCAVSGGTDWHIGGASKLSISGGGMDGEESAGQELFAVLTGGSVAQAQGFRLEKATLTLDGGAQLACHVTGVLGGSITGSSQVYYRGNPTLAAHVGSSSKLEKQ